MPICETNMLIILKYMIIAFVFLCSGKTVQVFSPEERVCSDFAMECNQGIPDFIPVFVTKVTTYK